MAQLSKSAYLAKYSAAFATNGTGSIRAVDLRELVQDTIDSFPSMLDNASMMGLSAYDPAKSYAVDQITYYNGTLYVCVAAATGSFNAAKWISLPMLVQMQSIAAWNSATTYAAGAVVRHKWKAYLSLAGTNLNREPGSEPSWWEAIPVNNSLVGNFYQADTYYNNNDVVELYDQTWLRNGAGYSSDFDTEKGLGLWQHRASFVRMKKLRAIFTDFDVLDTTTAYVEFDAALPAGAVPFSIKVKQSVRFTPGTIQAEVYFGTGHSAGRTLITAVVSDSVTNSSGTFASAPELHVLPNHAAPEKIGVLLTCGDANLYDMSAGGMDIWITYTVMT